MEATPVRSGKTPNVTSAMTMMEGWLSLHGVLDLCPAPPTNDESLFGDRHLVFTARLFCVEEDALHIVLG